MKNRKAVLFTSLVLGLGLTLVAVGILQGKVLSVAAAPAAELTVCPVGCTYSSIQDAMDAADHRDVIKVATGIYTGVQGRPAPSGYEGSAIITQVVYITKSVIIQGGYTAAFTGPPDPVGNPTVLDAQGLGRVIVMSGDITPTIEGLRITGGDASGLNGGIGANDVGGGVYALTATVTISNCTLYSNTASRVEWGYGGGVYAQSPVITLTGNTIVSNTATISSGLEIRGAGGGVCLFASHGTLNDNTVAGNTAGTGAQGYGGGLALAFGQFRLRGNTVQSNTASTAGVGLGGGILAESGAIALDANAIQFNVASAITTGSGGGIYALGTVVTLTGNTIASNTASAASGLETRSTGGGVSLAGGLDTLSGNTVRGNTASTDGEGYGGGIYALGTVVTLTGNIIVGNTASAASGFEFRGVGGGACLLTGHGTLSGNTVRGNTASTGAQGYGGGIILASGQFGLRDNTVQSNTASMASAGFGGGIMAEGGDITLEANGIQFNAASAITIGVGGGLVLWGSNATLRSNAILGNSASLSPSATSLGGGLQAGNGTTLTMTNDIVADNHAYAAGSGLWIGSGSGSPGGGRLLHTTIAHNLGSGQGVFVGDHTTVAFTNTIIVGHTQVGITATAGSTVTLAATLWYSNGVPTGGPGTITSSLDISGDPAFRDRVAGDYHLTAGSLAIDTGLDVGVDTDMDGDQRPADGDGDGIAAMDIGADEFLLRRIHLPLILRQSS